jgi:hypothetical protein
VSKIKHEWILCWKKRTGFQKCKKFNYVIAHYAGCYVIGCFSNIIMIGFIITGIVTTNKTISTAALVIIGACWCLSSLCLTIAILKQNDDWDAISSKFWSNVMTLFAVGSGLVFGKWVAGHK